MTWVRPGPSKSPQAKSAQAKSVTWLGVELAWSDWLGVTLLALLLCLAHAAARLLQARVQRRDKQVVEKAM